jgi:hypothetical protein
MQATLDARWLPQALQESLKEPANAEQFRDGQELIRSALLRSTTDEVFGQQLVARPRAAIAAHYQRLHDAPIPEEVLGVDIRFVENEGDVTVVLPRAIDPNAELSEAELESVAGGIIFVLAAPALVNGAVYAASFVAGVATVAVMAYMAKDS